MKRIFSTEENSAEPDIQQNDTLDKILDDVEGDELSTNIYTLAEESLNNSISQLDMVSGIYNKMVSNYDKIDISIENYKFILDNIASNLGIKAKYVSSEDFSNKYSYHDSRVISLESIGDFFKEVWERIKKFFKMLFDAFRGLLFGFNSSEKKHENIAVRLLRELDRIEKNDLRVLSNGPIFTKLPMYLADSGVETYTLNDLITSGYTKIENFINLTKVLNKTEKELDRSIYAALENYGLMGKDIHELATNIQVQIDYINLAADRGDGLKIESTITSINESVLKLQRIISNRPPLGVQLNDIYHAIPSSKAACPEDVLLDFSFLVIVSVFKMKTVDMLCDFTPFFATAFHEEDSDLVRPDIYEFTAVHVGMNESVSMYLDPLSDIEELKKLTNLYKELSKNSLIVDIDNIKKLAINVSDSFSNVLYLAKTNLIRAREVYREIYELGEEKESMDELFDNSLEFLSTLNYELARNIKTVTENLVEIPKAYMKVKNSFSEELGKYLVESAKRFE